jgi:hypothetical protein
MTELVTSGSVGGMASNGRLYPETPRHLIADDTRAIAATQRGTNARLILIAVNLGS